MGVAGACGWGRVEADVQMSECGLTYHGAGVAGSDASKAPGRNSIPCLAVTNFVCSRGCANVLF